MLISDAAQMFNYDKTFLLSTLGLIDLERLSTVLTVGCV